MFLALVSGDFLSHNKEKNEFVVSPEPDVSSFLLDLESMRCLVVGSDGLWDMVGPRVAVDVGVVRAQAVPDELGVRVQLAVRALVAVLERRRVLEAAHAHAPRAEHARHARQQRV